MKYKGVKNNFVSHLSFRVVEGSDAEFVTSLRLNDKLNQYLSNVNNDVAAQRHWISKYKQRESRREEFYFVIMEGSRRLGLVRIYDFNDDSFCWGSWMLLPNSPSYAAIESALFVYEFGFYELGFSSSHFDVRRENLKVVSFHKKFGAKVVSESELDYFFEITKETYLAAKQKYRKFLSTDTSS